MMTKKPMQLIYFPVSFFSMIMGLAGLTIATQKLESTFKIGHAVSTILAVLVLGIFMVFSALYARKFIKHRQAVINEFQHPIKLHFFPTMSISLLLLATLYLRICPVLSSMLWTLGTVLHLLFTLKIISMWMQQNHFEIIHINPSWFIPVVGNIIVPIVGVAHAPIEISWFFFSIGLIFWFILLVIFFNRAIFYPALPDKLLPTLFILIAPPALGFIAYFKLTQQLDAFAQVLYYFAIFTCLLLAVQSKLFTRIGFSLSWWAYSFPMAAITTASFLMYQQTSVQGFYLLALALYTVLILLISFIFMRTIIAIVQRKICVEAD